ncbi:hypothetical protein MIC448_1140007 [Microbacterium sp. C448]|uniref:hypothetical protein n=1 Tax=Microbacterium sp. C448 TaxID=1177594 RepID=UPI0003DE105C|nr:hypothetical protein [Microbacterium sp. C448]CDJ99053.1 hypothetical protein MIC448_1140007 [Microbacterium sp. C448]
MRRRPNQDGTVSSYVTKTGETKYRIAYQVNRAAHPDNLCRSDAPDAMAALRVAIDKVIDELKKRSRHG